MAEAAFDILDYDDTDDDIPSAAQVLDDDTPAGPTFGSHTPDFGTNDGGDLGPDTIPADVAFDMATTEEEDGSDEDDIFDLDAVPSGEIEINGDDLPADVRFELALLEPDAGGEAVGLAVSPASPGFDEFEAKRVALSRPVIRRVPVQKQTREWTLDFGPLTAPAGFVSVITVSPQVLFRGEKIVATDSLGGIGTRILQVAVGQKLQRPGGGNGQGTLTSMFAATALANGITFDTAHRWAQIKMTVSFVQPCTFDATVFGKAVV